jgi:hypothetical protein
MQASTERRLAEALGVDDTERTAKSVAGIVGKRLTYRRTDGQTSA